MPQRERLLNVFPLVALLLIAAFFSGCGDGGPDVGSQEEGSGELQVSEVYESRDPLDPLLSRVEFVASDEQPIEAIEVFGSKAGAAAFPETELIYGQGMDEPFEVQLDETGLPDELRVPGGASFKFDFQADTVFVHFLDADGGFGVESATLDQEIVDALDGVVVAAAGDRTFQPQEETEPMVSAVPGRIGRGGARVAAAPVAPPEPQTDPDAAVNVRAVRRSAVFSVTAETEDGSDATKAICCFTVNSSGEVHAFHQEDRTKTGFLVNVVHEVPVETVLNRINQCQGPNWWLVAGLLALTVLGSAFGAPILVAIFGGGAAGGTAATIVAGVGIPLVGGISIYQEASKPTCVETVTQELTQEYRGRETTVDICPISRQIEEFTPACIAGSYNPYDPARADFLGDFVFNVKLRDDIGQLEVCDLQSQGGADTPPRFTLDLREEGGALVVAQEMPPPFFAPEGYVSKCGETPVVEEPGEEVQPQPIIQSVFVASSLARQFEEDEEFKDAVYDAATVSVNIDPASTNWIAWNNAPDLAEGPSGEPVLGPGGFGTDDYIVVAVTSPDGQSRSVRMDSNDAFGRWDGPQNVIYGAAGDAPDVSRRYPSFADPPDKQFFIDEAGTHNDVFTTAGTYKFEFVFFNSFTADAGHQDIYLLIETQASPGAP